jgi:hypothetical protein
MKYEVRLADRGTYVMVRPSETTNWQDIVEHLSEATKISSTHNLRSFLIDVRGVESGFSTLEHYQIAHYEGRKLGFEAGSRIAVLVSPGDHSRDFVKTVVQNAGYSCELFDEESAAEDWLED